MEVNFWSIAFGTIVYLIGSTLCSNNVPVILWGPGAEHLTINRVSPLHKLTTSEFHHALETTLDTKGVSAISVFIEEALSVEDLNTRENGVTKFAYPALKKELEEGHSSKFIPYVNNPVKVFKALLNNEESSVTDRPKVVVKIVELDISGDDANSKSKSLLKHDEIIQEKCKELQTQYPSTLCVLTANRPSWINELESLSSRQLLQAASPTTAENNDSILAVYKADVAFLYTKSNPILKDNSTKESYEMKTPESPEQSNDANILKINYSLNKTSQFPSVTASFVFENHGNITWSLKNLLIQLSNTEVNLTAVTPIVDVSIGHSYHSPSKFVFKSDDGVYTVIFDGIQVQYEPNSRKFGPADDSVYFFTIPILSGLFVGSIILGIALIGLSMIWDIKTMDQFDDPKGKTITVSAAD